MPNYDYECPSCKNVEEVTKSISKSDSTETCIKCNAVMSKLLSSVAFKGGSYNPRMSIPDRYTKKEGTNK